MVKNMEEKISRGGLEITVRLVSSSTNKEKAQLNLENILNAFSQYSIYRYGNSFGAAVPSRSNTLIQESIYRSMREKYYMVASTEEMAGFGIYRSPVPKLRTSIGWARAKPRPRPTCPPKVLF